jgi:hypothetical protein
VVTGESNAADGDVVRLCLLDELAAGVDLDAEEIAADGLLGAAAAEASSAGSVRRLRGPATHRRVQLPE